MKTAAKLFAGLCDAVIALLVVTPVAVSVLSGWLCAGWLDEAHLTGTCVVPMLAQLKDVESGYVLLLPFGLVFLVGPLV
jgi:hypothetical protein